MNRVVSYTSAAGFLLVCLILWWWQEPISLVKDMISGMNMLSYVSYVTLLAIAVVIMPITVMPLIPVASAVMGPLATALLSMVGWTLGSTVAFLVARYLGRPILIKFVDLNKVDSLAGELRVGTRFWVIVLLRMTLPVDIVSYALGLTGTVKLPEYVLATLIGVSWFSFAFAYLGDALLAGNMPLLIELGSASTLVFILGWYILRRHYR